MKLTRKVLCLDWDKRSLRIVVARIGKARISLEDAHSHRLPNTVDADDPEAMGGFIRQMLRRHRLHMRSVVVDVARERAVINRLRLPPTPDGDLAAAVRFQAMKELPFPLDTAAVDFVVMTRDENGQATEVLLAAVTKETLDRVRLTCEAAGLTPARIGLRPYANLVSVQKQIQGTEDRRVLFVDTGPGATEIDVFCEGTLSFARSANVNVPLPIGDAGSREDSRVISIAEISDLESSDDAIEAAVGELLVETTRTLQAFRASQPDAAIDKIIVAGGTGIETQLAGRLHDHLRLPVDPFDPTGALDVDAGDAPKLRSFAAALGLAWGVSQEGLIAIDFLNPKQPISSREALQRRVRVVALAGVAVVVATIGVLGWEYHKRSTTLDGLHADNSELQTELKRKREIKRHIDFAKQWSIEAVWPDELLTLTELSHGDESDPGEELAIQDLALDAQRHPSITLRNVHVRDWQVRHDLVDRLNKHSADDKKAFVVRQGPSKEVDGLRYKSKVESIVIGLRQIQEQREEAEKATKKTKKKRSRKS